jgi:hypothetical protein
VPDQRNIAKALIRGKLPTREIAGILYDEVSSERPIAMQTPPPIANVEKAAKKSWVKAATAVLSKVPEYAGESVLRHKSKNLKNLYLAHGTDPGTLQSLQERGEVYPFGYEQWAEIVDLGWLENWAKKRSAGGRVMQVLARRMMQAGRYEAIAKWRGKSEEGRRSLIGAAVAYGIELNDIEVVEKLLGYVPSEKVRRATTWLGWELALGCVNETSLHIFKKYHTNQEEFLDSLEEVGQLANPTSEANYIELLRLVPINEASDQTLVSVEVAKQYLQATLLYANYWAIREIIEDLVNECTRGSFLPEADEVQKRHDILEKALEALGRFQPDEDRGLSSYLFGQYQEKLSEEAIYQALRFSSRHETWEWLNDDVNIPTSETFRRIVANPGNALPVGEDGRVDWASFCSAGYADNVGNLLGLPFAGELLEAMGSRGTELILAEAEGECDMFEDGSSAASDYLAARFTEHFGENAEAWRGAMRILPTSTQPLERTLRGVAKLYGVTKK